MWKVIPSSEYRAASLRNKTPLCASQGKTLRCKKCRTRSDFYRTLLSDSYRCDQLWKDRLRSPFLQKINAKQFGIALLDSFREEKNLSAVDLDLFANMIQDLPADFEYIAKQIFHRYRHCNTSIPIMDSIMHAVVRGYLEQGEVVDGLIEMIKDKSVYGIFPDVYSMCMLLDYFIEKKDYQVASQMAYEVMLQEEYEHQLRNLLSLYAAVKHLNHTMNLERNTLETPTKTMDEEMQYVAIPIIRNPYYDDHFDIKDERFLLGKTLYNLSRHTEVLDGPVSRSLQLIGLGLYEKFELANQLLAEWMTDASNERLVYKEALDRYKDFLSSAPTRDANAEPKSMGDKTIDDEIELLKLTEEEKSYRLSQLQDLTSSIKKEKLKDGKIEEQIDSYVSSRQFKKYESEDIKSITALYKQWAEERDTSVKMYMKEQARLKKIEDIQSKLAFLQEREELLTYFDNEVTVRSLARTRKEEEEEVESEEEYVEAPGERNVKQKIKRK